YAMKANPNAQILRLLAAEGLGFECVSRGEIEHLLASVPGLDRSRILFTPNFAGREEYRWALEAGITLTLDNLYVLRNWGELFRARSVFIRIDTGTGRGHHHHVRTAGAHAKFGVPLAELQELGRLVERHGAIVVGLHAHSGSGSFNAENWSHVATCLLDLVPHFPHVRVVDGGGGADRARHADQVQGRDSLRRYRHGHELADPSGSLRCLARDRQSHAHR